jgi:DNA-binding CsgD family transcriptional regulator
MRVEASPLAEDGTIAVVLVPERPPTPPTLPAAWSLTPRERHVVELLLRGFGNRRIAAALSVSENTVAWHLGHAYEKLGVGSRAQVLARFVRETYGPALDASDARDEGDEAILWRSPAAPRQ